MIPENTATDEIIANIRFQSQYDSFMKNIDEKRMAIRATLGGDKGVLIKDR